MYNVILIKHTKPIFVTNVNSSIFYGKFMHLLNITCTFNNDKILVCLLKLAVTTRIVIIYIFIYFNYHFQ